MSKSSAGEANHCNKAAKSCLSSIKLTGTPYKHAIAEQYGQVQECITLASPNKCAMQAIVFNIRTSLFSPYREAACLLAAYLLGARPCIVGDSADTINLTLHANKFPLSQKLSILTRLYEDNPDVAAGIAGLQKQLKKIEPLKARSKEMQRTYNNIARLTQINWKDYTGSLQKQFNDYGFWGIREMKDDTIFGYLHINANPEKADKAEIRISDLMQLLLVKEGGAQTAENDLFHSPELFFFGSEFLTDNYPKPHIYAATDAEAADIRTIYLQHVFTLPYLNKMKGADLQTARTGLLAAGGNVFCSAVDDWCYQCYDGELPETRLAAFREAVLPAAARLQQAVQHNAILQGYHQRQNGQSPTEVWIGEVPVFLIWQYYKDGKAVQEETWQKLEALKTDPAYQNQRWPVLMLKTEESPELDKPGDEEEKAPPAKPESPATTPPADKEIQPVKKYLDID